ncbi:MAG: thiamine-phosphate kinase [Amphiplicatus sp.]
MRAGEFDIIRSLFTPLAGEKGAFGLSDDAALLPAAEYVVTKDMMIAGVHFRPDDPLDLVARKLLRVNLSDLAAKGARPVGYFLACAWPKTATRAQIARFAEGLAADQAQFRIALYGGDTTKHRAAGAPLALSLTAFGAPARMGMIARKGAQVGDDIYVTGTIGDAGLGLAALDKRETFAKPARDYLVARYRLPEPRLVMGGALAGHASAAIDVSDGLIADAGHIAAVSGVGIEIEAGRLPLSPAAKDWLETQPARDAALARLAGFGDDYEILFAAPPSRRRSIDMAGKVSKTPVARIGQVVKGAGARLIGADGEAIPVESPGFDHFAG